MVAAAKKTGHQVEPNEFRLGTYGCWACSRISRLKIYAKKCLLKRRVVTELEKGWTKKRDMFRGGKWYWWFSVFRKDYGTELLGNVFAFSKYDSNAIVEALRNDEEYGGYDINFDCALMNLYPMAHRRACTDPEMGTVWDRDSVIVSIGGASIGVQETRR